MDDSPPSGRHSRRTGRTTLADVAAAAGVSPITVSRALRGERAVAPELVARVREAAEQLGYVPDPAARALASRRSSHVGVLVPLLSNTLFVDLLEAAHLALLPAGYQTLIGVTHYDPQEEEQLLHDQLLHRPAGLLVTGFDRSPGARALIARSGVPCVHLMETAPALGECSVGFSQFEAGRAITRHLLARGARRVAFAAAQLDPRTMSRGDGWRAALAEAGLGDGAPELLRPEPSSIALGAEMFEALMRPADGAAPPDAIFFCNDDLAQGALLAALRLGVRVPEEVAVAGFNDLPGSDQMLPPLTTVRTPRAEIGRTAATLLLQLMRGEPVSERAIDLGFEVIVRGST
jgi:LacI family gluconate utilization system Gnt-I transcriptional repressor